MPKTRIELPETIEHLSILNERGELDQTLEPAIPDALLLKLHRTMLLARRFDERLLSLQRQGRIGTFPPISCVRPPEFPPYQATESRFPYRSPFVPARQAYSHSASVGSR